MRIVVALGVLKPSEESSWLTRGEYESLWSADVADETALLSAAVEEALAASAVAVSPAGDRIWWPAHVRETESGSIQVTPSIPSPGYGIDERGRLLMDPGYGRLTVAEYLRAVDAGYYPSKRHELVIVPPPEVGGADGWIAQTIVEWFAQHAEGVLLAYLGSEALDHLRKGSERRLQQLAKDWAAQRIDSPFQLRQWIDKRGEWFPNEVAQRLSIPDAAAEELLRALGYQANELGLMQRRSTPECFGRRQQWLLAENGEFLERFDPEGWEAGLLDTESLARSSHRPRWAWWRRGRG